MRVCVCARARAYTQRFARSVHRPDGQIKNNIYLYIYIFIKMLEITNLSRESVFCEKPCALRSRTLRARTRPPITALINCDGVYIYTLGKLKGRKTSILIYGRAAPRRRPPPALWSPRLFPDAAPAPSAALCSPPSRPLYSRAIPFRKPMSTEAFAHKNTCFENKLSRI